MIDAAGDDRLHLTARWAGCERFVMLDTAFGDGSHFLATWAAWRDDPRRCGRLHCLAIAAQPPLAHHLGGSAPPALVEELRAAWPPLTPDIHRIEFDGGRVELLLVVDEADAALRGIVAEVDLFDLRGDGADAGDPRAALRRAKALARLAAAGALAVCAPGSNDERVALSAAGFVAEPAGGTLFRFAPRFAAARPPARPSRRAGSGTSRHVLVLGAGLAGCATAAALVEHGWTCTVIERHGRPAEAASGNAAGIFHGVVHGHDGHHARFNRAAAIEAARVYARLLAQQPVTALPLGAVSGLLRLGSGLPGVTEMAALLARLRLPPDHVEAVDAQRASSLAGLPVDVPAWFFPRGGWMRPAALARTWLDAAGTSCSTHFDTEVAAIRPSDAGWAVVDRGGSVVASAPHLVLANADGAQPLLDDLAETRYELPLQRVRGQSSRIALSELPAVPLPTLPLAGAGYLLPPLDGSLLFGATAQADDDDAEVRPRDHRENQARLAELSAALQPIAAIAAERFEGRTGWRCVAADRLPMIGPVPLAATGLRSAGRSDQPRFIERRGGLYLFTGLGSRGLTWAPLGARILVSWLSGAPMPIAADLLDAVDPARFLVRGSRRADAGGSGDR